MGLWPVWDSRYSFCRRYRTKVPRRCILPKYLLPSLHIQRLPGPMKHHQSRICCMTIRQSHYTRRSPIGLGCSWVSWWLFDASWRGSRRPPSDTHRQPSRCPAPIPSLTYIHVEFRQRESTVFRPTRPNGKLSHETAAFAPFSLETHLLSGALHQNAPARERTFARNLCPGARSPKQEEFELILISNLAFDLSM